MQAIIISLCQDRGRGRLRSRRMLHRTKTTMEIGHNNVEADLFYSSNWAFSVHRYFSSLSPQHLLHLRSERRKIECLISPFTYRSKSDIVLQLDISLPHTSSRIWYLFPSCSEQSSFSSNSMAGISFLLSWFLQSFGCRKCSVLSACGRTKASYSFRGYSSCTSLCSTRTTFLVPSDFPTCHYCHLYYFLCTQCYSSGIDMSYRRYCQIRCLRSRRDSKGRNPRGLLRRQLAVFHLQLLRYWHQEIMVDQAQYSFLVRSTVARITHLIRQCQV
mmetsp:Transcript_16439/g.36502  ORF Transcript_16439/g.36502 Transcript_16439/m.36502 type:complete len:273 (+) Transcript_16439:888-1706(+)